MAADRITLDINVRDLGLVKDVVEAAVAVVRARNAGADCYEAKAEIDRLERALNALAGS